MEQAFFHLGTVGEPSNFIHAGRHHCKWLFVPLFAPPQLVDGGFVTCIHRQVVASNPLDRYDTPFTKQLHRPGERVTRHRLALVVEQRQTRPACGAGSRLRMEAPVGRVPVFLPAAVAETELSHGCQGAIIGNTGDDRVTRAAIGAIDERVPVAAVAGVEQLPQAIGTHIAIGAYLGVAYAMAAGEDGKVVVVLEGERFRMYGRDHRQGRSLCLYSGQETVARGFAPLDLQFHSRGRVPDPPGQAALPGEPVDKGAKSDSLDNPFDFNPGPLHLPLRHPRFRFIPLPAPVPLLPGPSLSPT